MLRATPGWRRIWPRRSSVRTIWCTEGGVSWKWRCMSVSAGGRPWTRGIGVDEGQVLPLPLGELFADIATRSIHLRLSRRRGKMNIRYRVELSEAERSELGSLLRGGQHAARKLKRAQILLAADAGVPDETIAQSLGVGGSTVYRTKRHFVEGTLGEALHEEPRPGAKRKLTGQEEALLVATACSRPPEGRARWTIELLAGEMVRLTEHDSVSRETVRWRLAENELKPWREESVVRAEDRRRVRRAHGGRARSLRRTARPGAPGGVPRREPS